MKKKIGIIIQARSTSKRYPNKVLKKIGNKTIIEIILKRLKKVKTPLSIIFSIPSNEKNRNLFNHLKKLKANVFLGSEANVLDRYVKTAKKFKLDIIIRVTADCPLIDPKLIDKFLDYFNKSTLDYLSTSPRTYPDGFDFEIFTKKTLSKIKLKAKKKYDLEHVTSFLRRNKKLFKTKELDYHPKYEFDYSFLRLSLNTKKDYLTLKNIFINFGKNIYFSIDDIFNKQKFNKIFFKELKNKKNLAIKTRTGQILWTKAKKLIAGGNMILSKNPDRFLPGLWPTYYKSAKGCNIYDYDNNKFIDMSLMGIGTNVLGYANKLVDAAVLNSLKKGNMTTLNCREEVLLADKLIELHPWFDKVKFARTGGEANAVAIRISRAFAKKDNIAVCGYHGWHDWYLSANLNNNSNSKVLDKHLLKGLEIAGVPSSLAKTVFPFMYGDFKYLVKICKNHNIGVIKMEVCRNTEPDINFLKKVRRFSKKNNIVLIFDECTTGFRETLGGLHSRINVKPDMCIFGKALGNGYAITAILGKKNIMDCAEQTFISSTFWSERSGYVAALKTIEIMEKKKTWKKIRKIGLLIQKEWKKIFKKFQLEVKINGIPSLTNFTFKNNNEIYKTFITHEMLKKNILASNAIYCSISHTKKILKYYFHNLKKIIRLLKKCESEETFDSYLKIKPAISDFKRLN